MSKVTYPLAAIIIVLGLAVFGSHSGAAQTMTKTSSADVAIDIMSCAGASEGLGKYEEYSTDQTTYSKELCDYLMQKYDIQCNNFELDLNLCAKESFSYIKIQGYLQREGLKNIVANGIQVIEKTVKVEVEEEDDDDDNDNDNDRNHKHRDRHWDKDRDRYRDLPPCNEVKYGTHCDGSEDEDSWTDEDDKEQEEEPEEEQEDEEEPEQEEEEEEEEPVIKHG